MHPPVTPNHVAARSNSVHRHRRRIGIGRPRRRCRWLLHSQPRPAMMSAIRSCRSPWGQPGGVEGPPEQPTTAADLATVLVDKIMQASAATAAGSSLPNLETRRATSAASVPPMAVISMPSSPDIQRPSRTRPGRRRTRRRFRRGRAGVQADRNPGISLASQGTGGFTLPHDVVNTGTMASRYPCD